MKLQEIYGQIEANKRLIGRMYKGATIDELIVVPVGYETEFKQLYVHTLDAKQALALLTNKIGQLDINAEYQIYAVIGKTYIRQNNALFIININEITLE